MILKKFAILLKKVYDIDTLCVFLFSLNLHRREWKIEDKFIDKIQPQLYIYIYIEKNQNSIPFTKKCGRREIVMPFPSSW